MLGDINFTATPFQIISVKIDPPCSYDVYIYANDGASSHTVEVYKTKEYIKYLDEIFIPNTIARIADIPEVPVTSINGQIGDVIIDVPKSIQSDWDETDETSLAFIKNKPDEEDALVLLTEAGFIEPVTAADGSIYTDKNGNIYTL